MMGNMKGIGIVIFVLSIFIGMAFVPCSGMSEDNTMEKWIQDHTVKLTATTTCKYEQGYLSIKEVYTGVELKERFGVEQFTKELEIPVEAKMGRMDEGEEKVLVIEKFVVLTSESDPPHWWDYYEYPQWVWFKDSGIYERGLPINLAWKNTTKDTAKSEILKEGWVDNPIQWTEYVYDPVRGWTKGDGVATGVFGIFGRWHANLWGMSDGNVVANAHHDTPVPHKVDKLEEAEERVAGFFNESDDTEWSVYEDSYNLDNNVTSPYSDGWCTQIDYNPATWYVPNNYTRIQWAINNATAGDIIIVRDGTYNENVEVNKRLTIRSENGSDFTIVQAADANDHVFNITTDYVNLIGFMVTGAAHYNAGIRLKNVGHCTISDNKVLNNGDGFFLYHSSYNMISNNKIYENTDSGIDLLWDSMHNTILNNTFNSCGLYIAGATLNRVEDNTVNGLPLAYIENVGGIEITGAGQVILVNCKEITVTNSNLSCTTVGIELWNSSNCRIENNKICKNNQGIYLRDSSNNKVTNNKIREHNDWYSIELWNSSNNEISNNKICENLAGILLALSSNNYIYLNNFLSNNLNVLPSYSDSIWNSTEPITYKYNGSTFTNYMGNYWDDYKEKYPDAEEIDRTGIWNMPYRIYSENDSYPLIEPWENYFAQTENIFDTGAPANPYPSIFGTHNGTITPNVTIDVSKLYTYPCKGTGGHTEYVRIYNETGTIAEEYWEEYSGDWHNITFDNSFILEKGETYNYIIETGSYPQIIHKTEHNATGGEITCTQFTDANGRTYNGWIPAIRLE